MILLLNSSCLFAFQEFFMQAENFRTYAYVSLQIRYFCLRMEREVVARKGYILDGMGVSDLGISQKPARGIS
jgi:hypothetical protein